jgi:nucleotide-binding universal stress UspA family protein
MSQKAVKKFLVPHDFTPVADTALEHAAKVAITTQGEVHLLHVVSKPGQVEEARENLNKVIENATAKYGIAFTPHIRIGNIFDDIGDTAKEIKASLIFMGTHGARGWQKIVGSDALRVITHSEVPFIVVQQKGIKDTGYDDIVVPLDLDKETKQKLSIVADMAKYFNSRIHIITPTEDDEYLAHQLNSNIIFAKKFLSERGIEFTTHIAEDDFERAIVRLATSIDADLIAIMNMQANKVAGNFFSSSSEQHLITNDAQIPICVVNPMSSSFFYY